MCGAVSAAVGCLTSSVLVAEVGEAPDVAQADRVPHDAEQEVQLATPLAARLVFGQGRRVLGGDPVSRRVRPGQLAGLLPLQDVFRPEGVRRPPLARRVNRGLGQCPVQTRLPGLHRSANTTTSDQLRNTPRRYNIPTALVRDLDPVLLTLARARYFS